MRLASPNAGFSLVEVMVAILILGIALVGLTQGITTALGSAKESELQTSASLLAAGRIETLRVEGAIMDGESDGDCGDDLPLYTWKQSVTRTETPGLHQVEVAILHTNTGKKIYELKTLLFDAPEEPTTPEKAKAAQKKGRK